MKFRLFEEGSNPRHPRRDPTAALTWTTEPAHQYAGSIQLRWSTEYFFYSKKDDKEIFISSFNSNLCSRWSRHRCKKYVNSSTNASGKFSWTSLMFTLSPISCFVCVIVEKSIQHQTTLPYSGPTSLTCWVDSLNAIHLCSMVKLPNLKPEKAGSNRW